MIRFLFNKKLKLLLLLLGIVFSIFTLFGDKGIIKLVKLSSESKELDVEIAKLEKDNLKLYKTINSYKNDKRFVESIARKELGLAKENEIIYQFKESQ